MAACSQNRQRQLAQENRGRLCYESCRLKSIDAAAPAVEIRYSEAVIRRAHRRQPLQIHRSGHGPRWGRCWIYVEHTFQALLPRAWSQVIAT